LGVIMYTLIIGKPPFETQDVKTTYKRIKMNAYSFPENALISEAARSLITEILQTDPSKRPSLDMILAHEFFNQGTSIPKYLPTSTLACPPSLSYIKQFLPEVGTNGIVARSTVTKTKEDVNVVPPTTVQNNPKTVMSTERLKSTYNSNVGTNRVETPGTLNEKDFMSNRPLTTITKEVGKKEPSGKDSSSNFNVSSKAKTQSTYSTRNNANGPDTWVKKWVDYSSKYGLGYLLSNGQTGVFYNDSSKIIFDLKSGNFNYIERRTTDKQDVITSHNINEYPKELQKKVTLLHHFRSYLTGEVNNDEVDEEMVRKNEEMFKNGTFVYVKKWMRTKHAIMFRLSNKIVQVCFQDHTEIILSSESRVVTYVNKKGERTTYPLSTALDSNNQEMTKRLKYTKDILTHMLTNNPGNNQGSTGTNAMNPKVTEI